jgi:hypothetical protein
MRRSRSRPDDRPAKLLPFGVSANHHGRKGGKTTASLPPWRSCQYSISLSSKCGVFSVGADTTDISFAVRSPRRTARDRSATGWHLPGDGIDGLGLRHAGFSCAPFACEDRQQRNDAQRQGDAQQHRCSESNAGRWDTVCQGVDHREQREAGTVRDPPSPTDKHCDGAAHRGLRERAAMRRWPPEDRGSAGRGRPAPLVECHSDVRFWAPLSRRER